MNIAFDAKRVFHNSTGLGNYSRTLLTNLTTMHSDNEYFLCTPELSDHPFALNFCEAPYQHILPPKNTPGAWWRSLGIAKDLSKKNIQVFHGLSNELPAGLATRNIPSVVSMHDLLFMDFPGDYKWMDRQIYKHKFSKACERADKVIAISNATKDKLVNYFNVKEEKIEVIYQAVNPFYASESPDVLKTTVRAKWDIKEEFILFVSALSPRKNIMGLLKAMQTMKKPPLLVAVGYGNPKKARDFARKNKLPVIFTGSISNAELRALYQQAKIFIYPSLGEGFGIPIVEAMMSRTPIITSNISSMPEVAGHAALLVDPSHPESIGAAILQLWHDESLCNDLIKAGAEQMKKFSYEKCTEPVMKIYRELGASI